jgi:predicted nucleotidyltransferase
MGRLEVPQLPYYKTHRFLSVTNQGVNIKMLRNEIFETLRRFKATHAEHFGILSMGVFGSVARDQASEAADVDLAIQTRTPDLYNLVHLKEELEAQLHRRVDIVRLRDRMNASLRKRIERDLINV